MKAKAFLKRLFAFGIAGTFALSTPSPLKAQEGDPFENLEIPAESSDDFEELEDFNFDEEDLGDVPFAEDSGTFIEDGYDFSQDFADDEGFAELEGDLEADELGFEEAEPQLSESEEILPGEGLEALDDFPEGEEAFGDLEATPLEEIPLDEGVSDLIAPEEELALDEALDGAEEQQEAAVLPTEQTAEQAGVPPALLESSKEILGSEDPSFMLSKVPLLPPMSDVNWKKWAGPVLEKDYRVRRGDNLWRISERLFGTPFLWPKVWQLNAYFGNPHIIEPGDLLLFKPGNPNSSPQIALQMLDKGEPMLLPFIATAPKLSDLERLEKVISYQNQSPEPPFKHFLLESFPEEVGALPQQSVMAGFFFAPGDRFPLADVPDGEYSVVRIENSGYERRDAKETFGAYRVRLMGRTRVENGVGTITQAFGAMEPGDALVLEDFRINPFGLQPVRLGELGDDVDFIPLERGAYTGLSTFKSVGLRLPDEQMAPIGSLLEFVERGEPIGRGLVVHREGRFATLWMTEAEREITEGDSIR